MPRTAVRSDGARVREREIRADDKRDVAIETDDQTRILLEERLVHRGIRLLVERAMLDVRGRRPRFPSMERASRAIPA